MTDSPKVILFLDNSDGRAALAFSREFNEKERNDVIWVKTAKEAIETLATYGESIYQAHLEHDLDGELTVSSREDSGMEVIRFLEDASLKTFENCVFTVHTWNPKAGPKMVKRLQELGLKVKYVPFGSGK
jgi:hypothetical protein